MAGKFILVNRECLSKALLTDVRAGGENGSIGAVRSLIEPDLTRALTPMSEGGEAIEITVSRETFKEDRKFREDPVDTIIRNLIEENRTSEKIANELRVDRDVWQERAREYLAKMDELLDDLLRLRDLPNNAEAVEAVMRKTPVDRFGDPRGATREDITRMLRTAVDVVKVKDKV